MNRLVDPQLVNLCSNGLLDRHYVGSTFEDYVVPPEVDEPEPETLRRPYMGAAHHSEVPSEPGWFGDW
jgi:hypothetical protein